MGVQGAKPPYLSLVGFLADKTHAVGFRVGAGVVGCGVGPLVGARRAIPTRGRPSRPGRAPSHMASPKKPTRVRASLPGFGVPPNFPFP